MYRKAYLEISNICNLKCSFCIGTSRKPKSLDENEFKILAEKIRPHTEYLYLHVLGEPLLHPLLDKFLDIAYNLKFKVIITTNGTLLKEKQEILLNAKALHKINISLHAFEANSGVNIPLYIENCAEFAEKASENGMICNFRLWNLGEGLHSENDNILTIIKNYFKKEWTKNRNGYIIKDKIYLQWGEKFDWPDYSAKDYGEKCFCYGLRDQFAVLSNGTVVPCCLDHDGNINLGNLFEQELSDILNSERARKIYDGFSNKIASEKLCRHCGYSHQNFKL